MSLTLALAGNPNCGKTTLFNDLTGSSQYVGNWPGVTVEKKSGVLRSRYRDQDQSPDEKIHVMDLPGIYSLSPYTLEEVVTRQYLVGEQPDVIINLVDASNLERNLYLTGQLIETGIPVVVAMNMMDRVGKAGDQIDFDALGAALGCPVIGMTATRGAGVQAVVQAAVHLARTAADRPNRPSGFVFSPQLEAALADIAAQIRPDVPERLHRWVAVRAFERDTEALADVQAFDAAGQAAVEQRIAEAEAAFDDDNESIMTNERYDAIAALLKDRYRKQARGAASVSDRIDRVVTSRVFGLPIFAGIMFAVYWLSTFGGGLGSRITDWTNETLIGEWAIGSLSAWLEGLGTADWLRGLIVDGAAAGVGAVIGFLPQMCILFLALSLLEDCGYMSRVAFLMDRLFRKFNLSGKSFIPILISSGCAVPGIMASRTIENEKDRRMTIMISPFIPCGAKLPVIALITNTMFDGAWWMTPIIYFVGLFAIIFSGIVLKKTRLFGGEPAPFVMELPPYSLPRAKGTLIHVWDRVKSFIRKAGTIIFLSSIVIWFLQTFSWSLTMVETPDASILASIGRIFAVLFAPLGFGTWQTAVSTVSGLVAKENLVATMGVMFNVAEATETSEALLQGLRQMFAGNQAGIFAFLVFNMLCAPCFAAIGSIRREMGSRKWTAIAIAFQCALAYVFSLMVYQIGKLIVDGRPIDAGAAVGLAVAAATVFLLFRRDPGRRAAA